MSLRQALRDLAAGRPVSAADYERIDALCRRADEGGDPGDKASSAETAKTCGRCGTVTRQVYCPQCGARVSPA